MSIDRNLSRCLFLSISLSCFLSLLFPASASSPPSLPLSIHPSPPTPPLVRLPRSLSRAYAPANSPTLSRSRVKEIRIKMQMLQAQLELSRAVGGSQAAASQAGDGPRWQIKSVGGQWCDLLDDQIVQLNEAQVGGHRTVQLQGLGVVHFDKLVLVSSQTGQKFSLRES